MQTGSNIANNQLSAGNAQSANYIAQGNAINQGIGTIGNWYTQRPSAPSYTAPPLTGFGGSLPVSNVVGDPYGGA